MHAQKVSMQSPHHRFQAIRMAVKVIKSEALLVPARILVWLVSTAMAATNMRPALAVQGMSASIRACLAMSMAQQAPVNRLAARQIAKVVTPTSR